MIEVITSGLDWITLTLPTGAVMDQQFLERSLRCLDAVVADGHELQYCDLLGYSGVRSGGCFVGSRTDTHMVQFSGAYANQFFKEVYRYDAHVSRVDVQTTVKFTEMPKDVAKQVYRDSIDENNTIPVGRRRKIWLIVGSDGGDTCYVGSASSDARGRVYNKEVQSEDPLYTKCWRFEVMLRNGQATTFCRDYEKITTARPTFCANFVGFWYERRGASVPWLVDAGFTPVAPVRTLPTDDERKLNWLAHQVRPTVQYLLTRHDRDAILSLLGLS